MARRNDADAQAEETKPEVTQEKPTAPADRDDAGLLLDEHGLPVNANARAAALGDRPDPALPEDPAPAPPADPAE